MKKIFTSIFLLVSLSYGASKYNLLEKSEYDLFGEKDINKISFHKYLNDIVTRTNQNTPISVDSETVLDYLKNDKNTQIYHYRLTNVFKKDIEKNIFSTIKDNLILLTCKVASKIAFLTYGYTYEYEYEYYDKDNKFIKKITLDSSDCKLGKYQYDDSQTLLDYLTLSYKISQRSFPKMLNKKARVDSISIKYDEKSSEINTKITFISKEDDSKYSEYIKMLKRYSSNTACKDIALYTAYVYGIDLSVSFYKNVHTFIKTILLDLDNCTS